MGPGFPEPYRTPRDVRASYSARRPELRIGDLERDAAARALGEHYAAGRLDHDEFDARTTAAYAAKTGADLDVLFADLPAPRPARAAAPADRRPGLPVIPLLVLGFLVAMVVIAAATGGYPPIVPLIALLWLAGRRRRVWR